MANNEMKDPFLQELELMVERLSQRKDYEGSLQISTGLVNGKFTHMITASNNRDSQRKAQVVLEQAFNDYCLAEKTAELDHLFQEMLPESLKKSV